MRFIKLKLTVPVALVTSLILAGCVTVPVKDSQEVLSVCHTAAIDWPANLTLEQLKDKPIKQLEGGITMSKEGVKSVANVKTWREYEGLSKAGYEPASSFDLGMVWWFTSERGIIPFWERAVPAKQSYVRPLPMNRRLLQWLPLDLGTQISNEDTEAVAKAIKASKSWLEFYPDTKIIKQTSDRIQLSADGFILTLTVLSYGDFNHDGYDDALVQVSHSAIGGTLNYSFNAVLTRSNWVERLWVVRQL